LLPHSARNKDDGAGTEHGTGTNSDRRCTHKGQGAQLATLNSTAATFLLAAEVAARLTPEDFLDRDAHHVATSLHRDIAPRYTVGPRTQWSRKTHIAVFSLPRLHYHYAHRLLADAVARCIP
jgi:hypothetical protein